MAVKPVALGDIIIGFKVIAKTERRCINLNE